MLSVIICSKNRMLAPDFVKNIANTIGSEYELVHIDNSDTKYSIYKAYNEGVKLCKYDNLCFLHEDVHFHSKDWGKKIIEHLQTPNVGICGVAGRDFVSKVPAAWNKKLSGVNIIQSDKLGIRRTRRKLIPGDYKNPLREVITLDGVIMCCRKDIFEKISFDESIGGFHGYDFDICIQSAVHGYQNYVMYDIVMEHFSRGNPNADYYRALIKVFRKWKNSLPLFSREVKPGIIRRIGWIDCRGLTKLLCKMVRRNMPVNEIATEITYFSNTLKLRFPALRISWIKPEIYLMRCLHFPLKIFKKRNSECEN
ncbi:MAG: glycosyltransferase [Paludibacter sp.]|nr:glycosyltransferase [Paludibacter sp.]